MGNEDHPLESATGATVPRPCSVCTHPSHLRIDTELAKTASVKTITSKYNLTDSSVRRHVRSHLEGSLLQQTRHSGYPGSSDLVERLIEALDDVSAVRATALMSGQASVVLRAAAATESIVGQLMDRLGIDDLEVASVLREGEYLARAIAKAAHRHAGVGEFVASILQEPGEVKGDELATVLREIVKRGQDARAPEQETS